MILNDMLINEIREHAESQQPHECCGLLVEINQETRYWPCRNRSALLNQFDLHPADWADAEDAGEIVAVVHSHIDQSAEASPADRVGCEATGLPWVILAIPSGELRTLEPTGVKMPLIGREFAWGVCDCSTLVRDYFKGNLGIILPNCEPYEYGFWKRGLDLREKYLEIGFIEQPNDQSPQQHDVFLIQIRSNFSNHAAIYLGDDVILHHVEKRLSERVVYGGYWQQATRYIMRHQSLC